MSTTSGEESWTAALDVGLVRRLFARRPVPPPPVRRAADRMALAGRRLPVATRLARRAAPLGDGGPHLTRPVVLATRPDGVGTPAPVVSPRTEPARVSTPAQVLTTGLPRRVPAVRVDAGPARSPAGTAPVAGPVPRSVAPPVPVVTRVVRAEDGAGPMRTSAPPRPVVPGAPAAPAAPPAGPGPEPAALARVRPLRPGAAPAAPLRTTAHEHPHPLPGPASGVRRPVVSPRHEGTRAGPRPAVASAGPRLAAPARSPGSTARRTSGAAPPEVPAGTARAVPTAPVQLLPAAGRSHGSPTEPSPSAEDLVEQVLHRLGRELAVSAERRGLRPGEPGGGGLGR